MGFYIFEGHAKDREYHRLRMIVSANDPATITLLQRTWIQPSWICLGLGPGAGSILQSLGTQVAINGTVIGIDKKTTTSRDSLLLHMTSGEATFSISSSSTLWTWSIPSMC